jgi:putative zinc finger protein
MPHPSAEQLNAYLERELSPADHVEVARHLDGCADCALVIAELQHVVHEAASLKPLEPPPQVWARIARRLEPPEASLVGRRAEEKGKGQRAEGGGQTRRHMGWHTAWGPAWALATAALVIAAFLIGRLVEHRAVPPHDAAADHAQLVGGATAANVRERVLLVAVGDHLERSQMVLVELANAQTRDALDISAERQSADELLASNRLYRQTAAQIGQTSIADVLDDLERVLVEVANGPSQVSIEELAAIQQRIEAQGILFKVKIIGSEMRERGNSITAGRSQPIS